MIIGLDAGALAITDERLKVGVWRVTNNLLRELSRMDRKNEYRLYSFRPIERGVMGAFGPRMVNVVLRPAKGWMSLRLPIELKLRPVDVFLGLAQAVPHSSSYNLGFIYDLGFLYRPDAYGTSADRLKKQTQELVARADHVVTISESSKRDILSAYNIDKKLVTVCYPGVGLSVFTNYKRPRLVGGGGGKPYFLFIGSLNKAKDLPLAIEAFAIFLKKANKPYDFLLIGGDYWPDVTINQSIDLYHLRGQVHRLGFVPDAQLPAYYRGATAFVTTALHEGFCLPAAEAMACGTPVVAVNRGAMKEVVGEGGIIVHEASATAIVEALVAIASDTKMRSGLAQKALDQSKKYTWGRFAQQILDLINYAH